MYNALNHNFGGIRFLLRKEFVANIKQNSASDSMAGMIVRLRRILKIIPVYAPVSQMKKLMT